MDTIIGVSVNIPDVSSFTDATIGQTFSFNSTGGGPGAIEAIIILWYERP